MFHFNMGLNMILRQNEDATCCSVKASNNEVVDMRLAIVDEP